MYASADGSRKRRVFIFFLRRDRVLVYVAHFVFLGDVWVRTKRTAVASRRATNLATQYFSSPQIANPQIPGLFPQFQIRKFSRFASPLIRTFILINPQVENQRISYVGQSTNRKYSDFYDISWQLATQKTKGQSKRK